ncbi:MAG: T9SS type A sorting domain-containing protein [Candidatus Cloacimonetes bacterium]|nr:T9SS type A sorting domain-containing protein [Candidatus Cloacimonadota bacterium]
MNKKVFLVTVFAMLSILMMTAATIQPNKPLTYTGENLGLITIINLTGDQVGFQGADYNTANVSAAPDFSPQVLTITNEDRYDLVGYGPFTFYVTTDELLFMYRYGNGDWRIYDAPLSNQAFSFNLGAVPNAITNFEWKTGRLDEGTVPVELSLFSAALTAQKFVEIKWISESESSMLGYRVYRSESRVATDAILITPVMIPANNTSSTTEYNHIDREVSAGNTYYYWLEAVEYGISINYGPQYVAIPTEHVAPEIPQTQMGNAYPNPFKANTSTTIDVSVKTGETGTLTIYNVLGQIVKTVNVEGIKTVTWNGRDSQDNACGSGIYFYKLSTPSMNQTKKMVIIK